MNSYLLWAFIGSCILVNGAEIKNSRVILTGGVNGIGYACANNLLSRGAILAFFDSDSWNGMVAAVKLNNKFGIGRALFFSTDVANASQFQNDFKTAVELLGGLDIMINNAGVAFEPAWSSMIDTNVKGEIQGTLMAFDVMGKHKGGRGGTVVNIASIASFVPFKHLPGYTATQSAVLGFSRSVALSYNTTGVAVKTMCPGDTNTHLTRTRANRYFDFIDYNEAVRNLQNMDAQEPDAVCKEIMRMIEVAPNGAIWVVEKDKPTISLDIPHYREWGTPV